MKRGLTPVEMVWSILDIVYAEVGVLPDQHTPETLFCDAKSTIDCGRRVLLDATIWKQMPDRLCISQEEMDAMIHVLDPIDMDIAVGLRRGFSREDLQNILRNHLAASGR